MIQQYNLFASNIVKDQHSLKLLTVRRSPSNGFISQKG